MMSPGGGKEYYFVGLVMKYRRYYRDVWEMAEVKGEKLGNNDMLNAETYDPPA
jgi:hypothetical protein